jgi:hypothetical protein
MQCTPECEIRPATSGDVPAILELQERNLRVNGGALSVQFSREFSNRKTADRWADWPRSSNHPARVFYEQVGTGRAGYQA